jgi:hypothetical protein
LINKGSIIFWNEPFKYECNLFLENIEFPNKRFRGNHKRKKIMKTKEISLKNLKGKVNLEYLIKQDCLLMENTQCFL